MRLPRPTAQDPALEDMQEFFETVDDVAKAERELQRSIEQKTAAAAAAAAAARAPAAPSKQLDSTNLEWEGEWS